MMRFPELMLGARPVWDGEGAGGGGGGAAAFTPPAGMPAEFVGKDAGETLGKLWTGYGAEKTRAEGLRTQLATAPKAPEKPEGYEFKFNEKIAPYFPDPANNKVIGQVRSAFHKHGLSPTQAQGVIDDIYGPLAEGGFLTPPYNPKTELETFGKHFALDAAASTAALGENEAWAKGILGQLTGLPEGLKEAAQAELLAMTDTAGGNALLRVLKARLADSGIRVPDNSQSTQQSGALSDVELDKLTSDPRIDPRNEHSTDATKKYDPALRKQYDDGMAKRGREKFAGKQ